MPTGKRVDPYYSCNFVMEIDGIVVGGFAECSGLQAEISLEEVEEGGLNEYTHKLPKGTKYTNLTLKKGIIDKDDLWKWFQDAVNGKITRKNGYIALRNTKGEEKIRWKFIKAFPVKWTGPDLKGDSTTIAVETLELAHNGISRG